MKIFIVKGNSGDYDDWREWDVAYYTSRYEAEKHLAALVKREGEIRIARREASQSNEVLAAFNALPEEVQQQILTNKEETGIGAPCPYIFSDDTEYTITEIETQDRHTPQN